MATLAPSTPLRAVPASNSARRGGGGDGVGDGAPGADGGGGGRHGGDSDARGDAGGGRGCGAVVCRRAPGVKLQVYKQLLAVNAGFDQVIRGLEIGRASCRERV